jgi:hypothetical protein
MPSSGEASSLIQFPSSSLFMIPSQQTHLRFGTGGSMRRRSVRYSLCSLSSQLLDLLDHSRFHLHTVPALRRRHQAGIEELQTRALSGKAWDHFRPAATFPEPRVASEKKRQCFVYLGTSQRIKDERGQKVIRAPLRIRATATGLARILFEIVQYCTETPFRVGLLLISD